VYRSRDRFSCIAKYDDDPSQLSYVGLTEVALLLQPRFPALSEGFSQTHYDGTRTSLMNLHGEPWLTSFKLRLGREYPRLVRPNKQDSPEGLTGKSGAVRAAGASHFESRKLVK